MYINIAGWSSLVARRAHNPKVVGSNPAPAIWSIGAVVYLASLSRRRSWVQIPHGPFYGGIGEGVNTLVCGSSMRGFDSHIPP